ncbi:MAG TPA: PspC domain-containing protein [Tenuifilaceae bacterium]|nr:PspC domain-containing protein [Tenuifilaceae bacterium]HPE17032.1 PspC domain-containing protein [Tenuifilaceae bacterium]HPJ44683.1 PspC domain-containing protein [Tenuifilaceae bacterium]HPQ32947.1 PspC domain-containing protein [Tenuifilaceae bacterium]HRX66765.1 PspC domain-containing protein [Tenuifilaceae bacterium]
MKKTVTVSLGGVVFCLDDDAYRELSAYLNRLEVHFSKETDRREILNDIEARMAEHLKERVTSENMVVTISEIKRVIQIMGEPSDIGASESKRDSYRRENRAYRRMYRDPDNRILGGVCSGMAAYWDIDPIIIRILFVVAFFWGGGGLLVYIILWIVIPQADTIAEKLEMRGEPVTAENIGKSFQGNENQNKK